jgi:hypothetical protein
MAYGTPTLPPEILSYIFRLAAGEPYHTFDTSPLPPMFEGRRSWIPDLAMPNMKNAHGLEHP